MKAEYLSSINDPRLAFYRNLKDRELARLGNRFIAESEFVVRRLLASDYPVESVVVAARKAEALAGAVPAEVPFYVLPDEILDQVIGYSFHTGVIAVGHRKSSVPLETILSASTERSTLVVCPDIINFENLGSLIRIASAFGVDAIILGERCCDPFYRLSIRVSMGTIFRMPLLRSKHLLTDLARLQTEFGYELAATVLANDAEALPNARRGSRLAVLFGNEATGLSPADIAACDRRLTLPMCGGTDSLNVAVSAAVFLYHFSEKHAAPE